MAPTCAVLRPASVHPLLTVDMGGTVLKKQLAAAEPSTMVVPSLFGHLEKSRGGPREKEAALLSLQKESLGQQLDLMGQESIYMVILFPTAVLLL